MQTLQFPGNAAPEAPSSPRLAEILAESAALLEASRDSEDAEVRDASIDLAIRALRAAGMALAHDDEHPASRRRPLGRVIEGPWAKA